MNHSGGLIEKDIFDIREALSSFPEITRAILFGSRAKGNYRHGSDVDIAICGKNVTHETVITLSAILNEETRMPYQFDIVHFETIKNPDLKKHINRVGITLFNKSNTENLIQHAR